MRNSLSILSIVLILFCSGCCTSSLNELNASHVSTSFSNKIIRPVSWSIDRSSFISSQSIEVLPFGGDDASKDTKDRPKGDFFAIFEKNAVALMTSLFGNESADLPLGQASYILKIKVGKIESKVALLAWQEAQNTIILDFTLLEIKEGKEHVVTTFEASSTAVGQQGTGCNFHDKAHERANRAINDVFVKAQNLFIAALNNSSNRS